MTDKWIYILNSAGWTLAGVILTLTYQRIMAWYQRSHGEKVRLPLNPQSYLAMLIIMIALASAAFSGAGQIQTNRNEREVRDQNAAFQAQVACQNQVNADNAAVSAERGKRSQQDTDNAHTLAIAELNALTGPRDATVLTKLIDAFTVYDETYRANTAYRNAHAIVSSTTVCGPPVKPVAKK